MKLFEQYKLWMGVGMIDGCGLCNVIPKKYNKYFEIISPTVSDVEKLGKNRHVFWAYDLSDYCIHATNRAFAFNPLRQNIVLFICAMNDEL